MEVSFRPLYLEWRFRYNLLVVRSPFKRQWISTHLVDDNPSLRIIGEPLRNKEGQGQQMSKASKQRRGISRQRASKTLERARELNRATNLRAIPLVARKQNEWENKNSILQKENDRLRRELARATTKFLVWFHAFQPACMLAAEVGELFDATPRLISFEARRTKPFPGKVFTFRLGGAATCTIEIWDGPARIQVAPTKNAPPFLLAAPDNKLGELEKMALADYLRAPVSLSA